MVKFSLYGITLICFLGIDMVGIKHLMLPVFERHIGHLLADPVRMLPAGIFYSFYIVGILWFASWPALKADDPLKALLNGALLGLMCYATYEFTNYATLQDWHWEMVIRDSIWGGFLTGFSAWLGVIAVRAIF